MKAMTNEKMFVEDSHESFIFKLKRYKYVGYDNLIAR